MKHAIAELEIALHTAETNEPIHRAEGDIEQADLAAARILELRDAISVLKVIDGIRGISLPNPAPEPPHALGGMADGFDHGPKPEQLHALGDPAEWQPTTIRGWLETLPDGYRERALANMGEGSGLRGSTEADDLGTAVAYAFNWTESPEGYAFWHTIRKGEGFPPLPEPA